MKTTKEVVKETIDSLGVQASEDVKKAIEKLVTDVYEKGMLPKDAMGLSDEMIESMYNFAYRLYNTGKYEQASHIFRLLIMLNPVESRFMMGLAASYHMRKDYYNAATCYTICNILDPRDPLPHYHISDCYIETGNIEQALQELELCILCSEKFPVFDAIKDRAKLTIESLKDQLNTSTSKGAEEKVA